MNAYKLWGLLNLAISIGLVTVLLLVGSTATAPSHPVEKGALTATEAQLAVQNAALAAPVGAKGVSAAAWATEIADERARWLAGLTSGDAAIISSNDSIKCSVPVKYRFILESLADRSPEHRARIAELLYEVELSEHLVELAARNLEVRDLTEINRRADENAREALSQLVFAAGVDGARIAELMPLRETMGLIELSVRPGMEFRGTPMSVPQQIEVARIFERYGYTERNAMDIYRRENQSPGTIATVATMILSDAAQTLSADQVNALSTFFQAEEVRAQPSHDRPHG